MRFLGLFCATVGLLTLGATAFADQYTYTYQDAVNVRPSFDVYANGTSHASEYLWANPFNATKISPLPAGSPFTVYCVDLPNQFISPTTVNVTPFTLNTPTPGTKYDPTQIPGTYGMLQEAAWLLDHEVVTTINQKAAMQTAIWNIIDGDTDFDVTTGLFSIKAHSGDPTNVANIAFLANGFLHDLQLAIGLGGGHDNGILYAANRPPSLGQDMLGQAPIGSRGLTSTPEGASLLMFLPGLIPVAVGLRRRRNKAAGK